MYFVESNSDQFGGLLKILEYFISLLLDCIKVLKVKNLKVLVGKLILTENILNSM